MPQDRPNSDHLPSASSQDTSPKRVRIHGFIPIQSLPKLFCRKGQHKFDTILLLSNTFFLLV